MPMYEYECKRCGHTYEKLVFSSDRSKVRCPECGGDQNEQLFSTFSSKNDDASIATVGSRQCGESRFT